MSFWRNTQEELDGAFLNAVGRHRFKKARRLLEQGANPAAVDSDGFTALHRLTWAKGYSESDAINEFVFFLAPQLDINARNKEGKTCLYLVAEKAHELDLVERGPLGIAGIWFRCTGAAMMDFLIKRGARLDIADEQGRTFLHAAAACNNEVAVKECIRRAPAMVKVADNNGKYPYECDTCSVQHHDLLQWLKGKSAKPAAQKKKKKSPVAEKKVPAVDWILLEPDEVAHISVRKAIGYKLTEIFNFSQRTCTRITHNLDTKAETAETRSFDEFADKAAFIAAHQHLLRLGGKADETAIHGQKIDKPRLNKDQP